MPGAKLVFMTDSSVKGCFSLTALHSEAPQCSTRGPTCNFLCGFLFCQPFLQEERDVREPQPSLSLLMAKYTPLQGPGQLGWNYTGISSQSSQLWEQIEIVMKPESR